MSYLPVIDDLACAGHGDCADLAPQVFRLDALILKAAKACPSAAISDTEATVSP